MKRTRHTECKAGAAVRLHGYAPARLAVFALILADWRP